VQFNSHWERLYKIAVFQTDSQQLWKALTEAEAAIADRLNECPKYHGAVIGARESSSVTLKTGLPS
jgi:hypothetical protein